MLFRSIVEQAPYTIFSTADFERAMQVIAQIGVSRFMSRRFEGELRFWAIRSFMLSAFKEEMRSTRTILFPDEMDRIGASGVEQVAQTSH